MSSVILIAEDEASIEDAIEIYLKSQGYQTLKAANGVIAWELLQNCMSSLSSYYLPNRKILIRLPV